MRAHPYMYDDDDDDDDALLTSNSSGTGASAGADGNASAAIDYENQYTLSQQKTITYIPLSTSILSIIGSFTIFYMILYHKHKLRKLKHRLILFISVIDIACSVWTGLWALPAPEGEPSVYGACGNRQTCAVQGFFHQWSISVPMYTVALIFYYYEEVVHKKTDNEIANKYELWMHFVCAVYPLLTAVVALFIDGGLYNFDSMGCWIAPYPRGCKHIQDLTCTRGNLAYLFQWLFAGIEEAAAVILVVYCLWFLNKEVRTAEKSRKRRRHSFQRRRGRSSIKMDSSSLVETSWNTLYQAFAYAAVLVVTRSWSFIIIIIDQSGVANPFWIMLLQQFFPPLQGFWNAIIYIHPYYKNVRLQNTEASWYWCVKEAILHAPDATDTQEKYHHHHDDLLEVKWHGRPHHHEQDLKKITSITGILRDRSTININSSFDETSVGMVAAEKQQTKKKKCVTFEGIEDKDNSNDSKEPHELKVGFLSNHIDDDSVQLSDSSLVVDDEEIHSFSVSPAP